MDDSKLEFVLPLSNPPDHNIPVTATQALN